MDNASGQCCVGSNSEIFYPPKMIIINFHYHFHWCRVVVVFHNQTYMLSPFTSILSLFQTFVKLFTTWYWNVIWSATITHQQPSRTRNPVFRLNLSGVCGWVTRNIEGTKDTKAFEIFALNGILNESREVLEDRVKMIQDINCGRNSLSLFVEEIIFPYRFP